MKMLRFLIFTSFLWLAYSQRSQSTCTSVTYYNTLTLECKSCPDSNSAPLNVTYCKCKSGYEPSNRNIIGFQANGYCAKCNTTCSCASERSLIPAFDLDGSTHTTKTCITCAANAYPSASKDRCIPCPHYAMEFSVISGSCVCKSGFTTAGFSCVSNIDVSSLPSSLIPSVANPNSASLIQFESGLQIYSAVITFYYLHSAVGCNSYLDMQSCQSLANQCVLLDYLPSAIPCQLFRNLVAGQSQQIGSTDPGQVSKLPWLYYLGNPLNTYYDTTLTLFVSFQATQYSGTVSQMPYYIAKYTAGGDLVSFQLLTSEMMLCPHSVDDANHAKQFGVNMAITCNMDMTPFLTDYTTYIYELYILDQPASQSYKPIAILNKNYKAADGSFPNQGNNIAGYQFTRRFYLVDNLASIEGDFQSAQNQPSVLRYPSNIHFNLRLISQSNQRIYVPFVEISYGQITINQGVLQDPVQTLSFSVYHNYEPSYFWQVSTILLIVYMFILFFVWLIRLYVWTKGNPRRTYGDGYFGALLFNMIRLATDVWNDGIFYFIMLLTGYWFVFYKLQNNIYVLVPDQSDYSNYRPFDIFFYLMFSLRMINMFYLIYKQSSINLCFIDWERTEIYRPKDIEEAQMGDNPIAKAVIKNKVSVWRTLLIANEFNELQTDRTISIDWTLLIFGLVMVGLGWKDLAAEQPTLSTGYHYVKNNYVLQYFISQFIYMFIGLVQIIFRRMFNIWYSYPVEDFVDLCTIANISIFIIDDHLHGYYIHGENPLGFAEGSAEHLQACLNNEKSGKGKPRGLRDSTQDHVQTYEVYLPLPFKKRFTTAYDRVRNLKRVTEIKSLGIEETELQRYQLQVFMKNRISELKARANTNIISKQALARFFNYPPDDVDSEEFRKHNLPFLYEDPDFNVKQLFFSGYEYYFLVTDVMIFNFWLIVVDNFVGAIILLYTSIQLMAYIKATLSESNLSDKTKIDPRFLI